MMSFVKGAALLLLLATVCVSADDEHCGGLNKTIPAKDLQKVYGHWVLVWSVSNHQEGWELLANVTSSHVELEHHADDNTVMFTERNMFVDKSCNRYDIKMGMPSDPEEFRLHATSATLEKDGVSSVYNESGEAQFFVTLEDRMVMHYKDNRVEYLLIYRREGHHRDAEKMKEDHDSHMKLAVCLGFPHEVVFAYDGETDFCHKKSAPEPAAPEPDAPEPAAPEPAAPEPAAHDPTA